MRVNVGVMDVVRSPADYQQLCQQARADGRRVALVPTMGALHDGHLALVTEATKLADFVTLSIFVNPTQFGPAEDLDRYPRTFEQDCARCQRAGVAAVFAPTNDDMYPPGDETRVRVAATAAEFCGRHRPGHFEGVATIVTKLFALAGPCIGVFGRKDYQQLQVIRRFVTDLFLPVQVVGVPTVREDDGLALSSRNVYLSTEQRANARTIPRALSVVVGAFAAGERRVGELRQLVQQPLTAVADSIDYVQLADASKLSLLADADTVSDRAVLAVAARFGSTRLIDNVVLGEDPAPIPTRIDEHARE